jgi:hypothetical protein
MAAGYEDCKDADYLRIDPALRLALDKGHEAGASQSRLSRLENDLLGNAGGLEALDAAPRHGHPVKAEEQEAADYRSGFHRGAGPRQAGGSGL